MGVVSMQKLRSGEETDLEISQTRRTMAQEKNSYRCDKNSDETRRLYSDSN